jgi:3-methyl-2-oxobutanoate hydroxymethyltransferase
MISARIRHIYCKVRRNTRQVNNDRPVLEDMTVMSAQTRTRRRTVRDLAKGGTPSVWLTAYTTSMARALDPIVDVMLVGDSLGMVLYGYPSTLPVSLDMMIQHGAAVMRGSERALVVVDLPFGSYQESPEQAFRNAARVMAETGCGAVKLEGGAEMAPTIQFLTQRGVPVCGHIGLMPQSVNTVGGFRAQGKAEAEAAKVVADAHAVADAGVFALVIEGTVEPVARAITAEVAVPTIGIGASVACDGQVLVVDDVLGLFSDFTPRFVKRYAELGQEISRAAAQYAEEVRARSFPGPEHCFAAPKT